MLKEIIHLNDEDEARRILMRLGNGISQVDAFIIEWKTAKEASKPKIKPVIVQKVITETEVEKEVDTPKQVKVITK